MLVPPVVRNKALAAGAARWLHELPGLIAGLEREWGITVGPPYPDATEAFVAEARPASVLKLMIPRDGDHARNEIKWNVLEAPGELQHGAFKLVDPDGLLAEAEYDLGILATADLVAA
jgi:hypothetical protein